MPDEPTPPVPMNLQVNLPPDHEVGIFADFANIWHTPNTFVLDFLSVARPPILNDGEEVPTLDTRVAARVRIPPEQIFPLIEALREQGQQWLSETGRSTPPDTWMPSTQPVEDE